MAAIYHRWNLLNLKKYCSLKPTSPKSINCIQQNDVKHEESLAKSISVNNLLHAKPPVTQNRENFLNLPKIQPQIFPGS